MPLPFLASARDGLWRELDSSFELGRAIESKFGIFAWFTPRVPLLSDGTERTEIDMKLGNVLFEAKHTEGDFQIERAELVERYRILNRSSNVANFQET